MFKCHGVNVSQYNIVQQTCRAIIPRTLGPFILIRNTHTVYHDDNGIPFHIESRIFSADFGIVEIDNNNIIYELEAGNPLIICNMSHIMVLIGLDYVPSTFASPQILSAWAADPVPHSFGAPDMGPEFRDLHVTEFISPPMRQLRSLVTVHLS